MRGRHLSDIKLNVSTRKGWGWGGHKTKWGEGGRVHHVCRAKKQNLKKKERVGEKKKDDKLPPLNHANKV